MTYNKDDCMWYGIKTERLALDITKYDATSKFYEYDTGNVYITDGSAWILI